MQERQLVLRAHGRREVFAIESDTFAPIAFSGQCADLQGAPLVSAVGRTGKYGDIIQAPRFVKGVAGFKVAKGDASGQFKVVHGLGSDLYHVSVTPVESEVKLLTSVAGQGLDEFTILVKPLNPVFNTDVELTVSYLVTCL